MREGKPATDAFVVNMRRVLNPLLEKKRKI